MSTEANCIFCKIVEGKIPAQKIYEDEQVVAFNDINPQTPMHFLVIPREHIVSLREAETKHAAVLGHALLVGAKIADEKGVGEKGFRTVINTGEHGGQTVFHLHIHVLGGKALGWNWD